jgi:hypothetical protein
MTWEQFAGVLLKLAAVLNALDIDRRKQKEEILKAVSRAFINTEKYYALRGADSAQDRAKEFDLAHEWEQAAILIQAVDEGLANRLALKSRFWREGGTWSDEQIEAAGIQLERVRAEGMSLFGKKAKKK